MFGEGVDVNTWPEIGCLEVLEVCNGSFRGVNRLFMGVNRLFYLVEGVDVIHRVL